MLVCANGDVREFCESHGLDICEEYTGEIEAYRGDCRVIVTNREFTMFEYYYLKLQMLRRGIEVISIYLHEGILDRFVLYLVRREKADRVQKYKGRLAFGFHWEGDKAVENEDAMSVARRILEMRDAGYTLKQISEDAGVHYPDGRKLSISTIQVILKNRGRYESDG